MTTTCSAIAGIALVLRFMSNGVLKVGYYADDWFMLVTLLTFWAAAGVSIWGTSSVRHLPHSPNRDKVSSKQTGCLS